MRVSPEFSRSNAQTGRNPVASTAKTTASNIGAYCASYGQLMKTRRSYSGVSATTG
jgi:hypothetical protein